MRERERENVEDEEGNIEMYVGDGERRVNLTSVKTRALYKCLGGMDVRRLAAEKVWE